MRKKLIFYVILIFLLAGLTSGCSKLFYRFVFGTDDIPSQSSEAAESHTPESADSVAAELSSESSSEYETTPLSSDEDGSIPYHFEPRDETVYTTDRLNIRTAPSTEADIVVLMDADKALKRTGYHEEWSRLEYAGKTVYASSEYLTTVSPSLSNEIYNYGYDPVHRDDQNIPGLINWHIRNWGNEADFIQDRDSHLIYLTIDEGYETGNTASILDILKEKNVSAVFFITKGFLDAQPQLVQRIIDEGHILGNHTCAHPAAGMPSLSPEEQKEDIMKLHNLVLDQFGYEMKLFRFPAGIYSAQSLNIVSSLGYRSVFWSFAYHDFEVENQPDPVASLKKCIDELHPGAIYLLHAVSDTNEKILGDWIDAARAAGYEFGTYPIPQ